MFMAMLISKTNTENRKNIVTEHLEIVYIYVYVYKTL